MRNPLAVILALGAASLYGLGNALEHRVVTETETGSALDVGLLRRLARRPLWLLGMFGDVGAFGLQAAALALGTLLVVQPLLACGLLVALPMSARWSGRSIQRRELIAAVVLCASLATFLIVAAPGGGVSHASVASWLRVGGSVGIVIVAAVLVAGATSGHVRAALLGFAAGGLFGITAALTKTFVDQIQHGVPYTASHWEVYGLAILSITGILFTQHGFQASSLSASLPALEATEPVVAAIVGIVLLHEHLSGRTAFENVLIGASIFAALTCVVFLASMAGHDATRVAADTTEVAPLEKVRLQPAGGRERRAAYAPMSLASAHDAYARASRLRARQRRRRVRHTVVGSDDETR